MIDEEIRAQLKRIDEAEDLRVSSWEAGFIQNILYGWPTKNFPERSTEMVSFRLSKKQHIKAMEIIKRYKIDASGGQETITKLPPGTERHFRKRI